MSVGGGAAAQFLHGDAVGQVHGVTVGHVGHVGIGVQIWHSTQVCCDEGQELLDEQTRVRNA